jgi:predicted transcriptional regulator
VFGDLHPDQQRRLRVLAKREDRPQAELIRQAVTEFLTRHDEHRLPSWVGSAKDAGATDSSTIKREIRRVRTEVDRRSDGGR